MNSFNLTHTFSCPSSPENSTFLRIRSLGCVRIPWYEARNVVRHSQEASHLFLGSWSLHGFWWIPLLSCLVVFRLYQKQNRRTRSYNFLFGIFLCWGLDLFLGVSLVPVWVLCRALLDSGRRKVCRRSCSKHR